MDSSFNHRFQSLKYWGRYCYKCHTKLLCLSARLRYFSRSSVLCDPVTQLHSEDYEQNDVFDSQTCPIKTSYVDLFTVLFSLQNALKMHWNFFHIFLWLNIIPVPYVPKFINPFTYWRASWLLPSLDNYK